MIIPELFQVRRFMPLFCTQFIGAFNDNFFKNAMLILVTYKLFANRPGGAESAQMLVNLAGGIFILPFFLFSAPAGQLADKFDRARNHPPAENLGDSADDAGRTGHAAPHLCSLD